MDQFRAFTQTARFQIVARLSYRVLMRHGFVTAALIAKAPSEEYAPGS